MRKPKELAVLIEVAAWREREAQSRDVPRGRVLKDDAVGDIAMQAPTSLERLASLRSLPKGFERSQWGRIVAAVQRGLARDPETLPQIEKPRGNPTARPRRTAQGAAAHDLGTPRRRRQGDRHRRRSRPDRRRRRGRRRRLNGWRRELFGEAALALKHGRLALAIEKGRVVTVDRDETAQSASRVPRMQRSGPRLRPGALLFRCPGGWVPALAEP